MRRFGLVAALIKIPSVRPGFCFEINAESLLKKQAGKKQLNLPAAFVLEAFNLRRNGRQLFKKLTAFPSLSNLS